MRICSLLPSATEILFALGLGDQVLGVTHECDYPAAARTRKVLVHSRVDTATLSPAEIDRQVSELTSRGESVYVIDDEELARLQPDLILSQDLCHVCAASPGDLASALSKLPAQPRVLTLTPRTLAEVWQDIRTVGDATGRAAEAAALVAEIESRLAAVRAAVSKAPTRPRVLCLEWLDPPFIGGHWVPEMVALAGGEDALGRPGEPSRRISWDEALATNPDIILIMPCGYDSPAAAEEFRRTKFPAGWESLPAVRNQAVYSLDANSYFSRPGPRLIEGIELLAFLFHQQPASATRAPT